ncbi:hypothetical protein [Paractinoplanes atraurantiacus]|uniref:Uncharacterized protein n=1 Tax=Paractinoplanes atraurantiacus TaxID=1036182 RepID=A0A285IYX5_9ACTN|nr:hypothetical protein [Actinoplanes atraurantiacus]SNY53255.1 hypothetical protein SAMN05421748_113223 [Actinoplanes atraurantiacus]
MKRALILLIVVAAAVALAGKAEAPAPQASDLMVDESVPEQTLVMDALRIDFDRRHGSPQHFALVPRTRPPGLLSMSIGSNGPNSVVDSYHFGEQKLGALVELATRPTDTCATVEMCVRNDDEHVTVYFSGNVATTPRAGDPETDAARAFWSKAEMVPVAEAAWFTELLARGRE